MSRVAVFLRRIAWGGTAALLCMVAMYALCYALTGALDPRLWPLHIHDLGISLGLCVGLVAGIFTACKYDPQ